MRIYKDDMKNYLKIKKFHPHQSNTNIYLTSKQKHWKEITVKSLTDDMKAYHLNPHQSNNDMGLLIEQKCERNTQHTHSWHETTT